MARYEVIQQDGKRLIVAARDLEHLAHILKHLDPPRAWSSIKPYVSMARATV